MVRKRRADRRAEMRVLLERWERSGLALSRFADSKGIERKTLYRWRRRLGVGGDRLRRGRRATSRGVDGDGRLQPAAIFTEVSSALRTAGSSLARFEVVLGDGTTVRIPEHFDPGSLRILIETLRVC